MNKSILFYILLAAIVSIALAAFHYLYKNKSNDKIKFSLFFLRFISFFSLLLLLINPKIRKNLKKIVKPSLIVLVDNSKSINSLGQDSVIKSISEKFKNDKELSDKFQLDFFAFSDDIEQIDTFSFNKNKTNIYQSLKSINTLYKKAIAPVILITDGNQTLGNDYSNFESKQRIYPLIIGDTTKYQDVKITQLNVNKYAYLKHKFPIEVFVLYDGDKTNVPIKFTLTEGNNTIHSKKLILGKIKNSTQIAFHIPASSVGLHQYKAKVSYLKDEKNTINNLQNFAVEVINEQSKIVIVSDILHPDIAMLKRAIESNKQRKVVFKKSTDNFILADYQLAILYQPTAKFKTIFSRLREEKKNMLIYTGSKTDWNFLNNNQNFFSKKAINKTEEYLANYNSGYSTFIVEDLGFSSFPPVTDFFGDVSFKVPYETILYQQIGNYASKEPLLVTLEQNNRRVAVFLGENSWRWRMSSKVEKKTFQSYDTFLNKLVQYLASNKRSKLLEVESNAYYYANEQIKIKAQYYNANYEFDSKARLWITVTNKETKKQIKYPFALQNNSFEVNMTNLQSGNYYYSVSDALKKKTVKGSFTVLNYDTEQQFVGANKKVLTNLAINTNGKAYYPNQYKALIDELIQDEKYVNIQKIKEKITPLIDWKWLLGIIALALSTEWFIRKYKGYL